MCTNEIVAYDVLRRTTYDQMDCMLKRFETFLNKNHVKRSFVVF